MRYNPNRSYFHPVLRPHSDDFSIDGTGGVDVQWRRIANDFHFSVKFQVGVAAERGRASCLAVIYCPVTLHRQAISKCPDQPFLLEGRTPRSSVVGQIEIYPIIVANYDLELDTKDAHSDYQKQSVQVRKGAPLATYYPWICDAPQEARPVESIVALDVDETLDSGEFEVDTDPVKNYIIVKANRKTRGDWDAVESKTRLATIYLAAVAQALGELTSLDRDNENDSAWVNCLRRQLRIQNLRLGTSDDDGESDVDSGKVVSPTRAAQLLLRKPMVSLLAADQDDEDEE